VSNYTCTNAVSFCLIQITPKIRSHNVRQINPHSFSVGIIATQEVQGPTAKGTDIAPLETSILEPIPASV
jgi:hypothetical protein